MNSSRSPHVYLPQERKRWQDPEVRCEIDRNQLSFETKRNVIKTFPIRKACLEPQTKTTHDFGIGSVEGRRLAVNLTTDDNGDSRPGDQPIGPPLLGSH